MDEKNENSSNTPPDEQIDIKNIPETHHNGKIIPSIIDKEMRSSYLDYAMSVIVSRALPDVRDGLKPVHRRILFSMYEMGVVHNKPFKKSARIVGDCLGKYHPHGDSAVYDAMVRMTQDFSLRYPLLQGQGNFGSIDGDSAAAMRYTEIRLNKLSEEILEDIKKQTVDFRPNFDASLEEPSVLPAKVPNLLINGSSGIAVGMATNIPPHNMSEIISGTIAIIDNPELSIKELAEHIQGPDFPTGGKILGKGGILSYFLYGRGKVLIRASISIEEKSSRKKLIVTEIPYQVNKSMLLEQIAQLVRDKIISGISDIRDESDREGMRIVIELKKDANEAVVENQLYSHTRLQTTFGVILLGLVDNEPKVLNIKQLLENFILHRKEVVRRRTAFDLDKAEKRAHILEGLIIALNSIDDAISIIKRSKSAIEAKDGLMQRFSLTDMQSQAILDMKLQRLTGLEQDKIRQEHKDLLTLILELKSILASEQKILDIIKKELLYLKENYSDARRTEIIAGDNRIIQEEDMIKEEEMVVTISHQGYIKRQPVDVYRQQKRGGKGIIAQSTKEEDFVEHLFIASTHSYILLFTDKGQLYWLKVYNVPEGSRQSRGKAIINLIEGMAPDERIEAMIPVKDFDHGRFLMLVTKKGTVKKTPLILFSKPRRGGIKAITLEEGDILVNAILTSGNQQVLIATKEGMAVKFNEQDARPIGRTSKGVKGITLRKEDEVIGMVIAEEERTILTITENGYGKRTYVDDYRLINRGGIGVINIKTTERNGKVVAIRSVSPDDDIMFISQHGIIIRTPVNDISVIGRNTQGLRLMRLEETDKVMAAARLIKEEEEPEEIPASDASSEICDIPEPDVLEDEPEDEDTEVITGLESGDEDEVSDDESDSDNK